MILKPMSEHITRLELNIPRSPLPTTIIVGANILGKIPDELDLSSHTQFIVITDDQLNIPGQVEFAQRLEQTSKPVHQFTISASEINKTEEEANRVLSEILASEPPVDRKMLIFALGGGVIGDMAGYIAGKCLRGVDYCQVPTTLLAMVDSSLGGKTAVDYKGITNMIGVFHLPWATVMDVNVLRTLPDRQFQSGLAELVKHAFLDTELFRFIAGINALDLRQSNDKLIEGLRLSAGYKMSIVGQDFEERTGKRKILNLGHTIGRAIETATGLTRFTHGEAVSLGTTAALMISNEVGLLPKQEMENLLDIIERFGLLTRTSNIDRDILWAAINVDKKSVGGIPKFVLLEGIGKARIDCEVDRQIVDKVLDGIILNRESAYSPRNL